jgi:putative FmdB family regulatory protein
MPLYEYLCQGCGRRFEAMRRMSERANGPACPSCGREESALAMSATAFVGGSHGGGAGGACSTGAWTGGG